MNSLVQTTVEYQFEHDHSASVWYFPLANALIRTFYLRRVAIRYSVVSETESSRCTCMSLYIFARVGIISNLNQ